MSGEEKKEIRYSETIEMYQRLFIEQIHYYRDALKNSSPYPTGNSLDPDIAFFGTGYAMSDFASVFDMYGKFMAGRDVDVLYNEKFKDLTDSDIINSLVDIEATEYDHDLKSVELPKFNTYLRDLNSVNSTSYSIGKSLIESRRQRTLSQFTSNLRYRMLPVAAQQWGTHLDWNQSVIATYLDAVKMYYALSHDVIEQNYELAAKNSIWPFTVLEYERAALGVVSQGGAGMVSEGPSTGEKVAAGALSGAAAGTTIAPGWGTAIGAVVGAASGFL